MNVSGAGSAAAFAQSYGVAVAKKAQGANAATAESNLQLIQSAAAPPTIMPATSARTFHATPPGGQSASLLGRIGCWSRSRSLKKPITPPAMARRNWAVGEEADMGGERVGRACSPAKAGA